MPYSDIETLPDECLIEIFAYLTSNELKNVSLACRIFASIIDSSTRLMDRNFFMVITKKRKWDYGALELLKRKHQSLVFFDFSTVDVDELLLKGLDIVGVNLKSLEFNDCNLSAGDFVTILSTVDSIKHLKIVNTKVLGTSGKFPSFKKLVRLEVKKSEVEYDIFSNARNLRDIEIETGDTHTDLCQFQKILFSQNHLKNLTLVNLRLSNLFDIRASCSFQLESLKLIQCHFRHKENFEIFLVNQLSLTDIELSLSNMKLSLDRMRYFDSIIACLLRKCSRTLTLNLEEYKFVNFDFMEMSPVKQLSLRSKDSNFSSLNFLKYFPLLECLEIDIKELNDENLKIINESATLNTLKVITVSSECFGKVKNKNIKALYIRETLIDPCDWIKFTENNPQICKLVIHFSFLMDFDVNLLDIITKKLELQHVELFDKYVGFDNEIYKMICGNCKNLKYLKLWNINIEKNFGESDKDYLKDRNIKFHLFNDESLNKPMIPF